MDRGRDKDLASRLTNRVQITTDGHRPYIDAIEQSFGRDVDYAMLVKEYGPVPGAGRPAPAVVVRQDIHPVSGNPNPEHISRATSSGTQTASSTSTFRRAASATC